MCITRNYLLRKHLMYVISCEFRTDLAYQLFGSFAHGHMSSAWIPMSDTVNRLVRFMFGCGFSKKGMTCVNSSVYTHIWNRLLTMQQTYIYQEFNTIH